MVTEAGKKAFGQSQHVTDATMRIRDVLYESLLRWRGIRIDEGFARAEANNLSMVIVETLRQLADESKPPPVRRACRLQPWCSLIEGHEGDCKLPPF